MENLKMHSLDGVQRNIELIGKLFPNAITEVKRNGKVEHAIDFDVLRQEFSDSIVEGREERYQFTWPDKKKAMLAANAPITATLRPVVADSVGKDGTPGGFDSENLYIEGDNLEVLKLLQETYLGKVKMIYIDPPYNTGNDFVYNDDFSVECGEWRVKSGDYDESGNRMVTNTESNGRFHTDWLNMIYPRLKIAKDLLADDGYMMISIGSAELDNLLKICDEVFGRENRAGICSRQMKTGNNQGKFFTQNTDYVIVYVKNETLANPLKDDMSEELIDKVYNKIQATGVRKGQRYRTMGLFQASLKHGGSSYPIECPDGTYCITPDGLPWRWNEKTFLEKKKEDEVVFIKTKTSPLINPQTGGKSEWNIYTKIWLDSRMDAGQLPSDLILKFENRHAAKELVNLKIPFDFPKPTALLKYLLHLISDKEYYILDFFSGSATTAHAVMQLNAEDGGHRKFIMVQLPEKTDEKSEAYKAGYKNICEIGKERIRRAGKQILSAGGQLSMDGVRLDTNSTLNTPNSTLDVGFRCLRLDSSNMENVYYTPEEVSQQDLFSLVDNVKPDRTPEDLLFQVMLDLGVLLSSPIEATEIAGKKVFNVANGFLLACFDHDVTEETVKAIAQMKPYYAVFRDSSMANDSVATNFDQIFETYSPDTVRKVL